MEQHKKSITKTNQIIAVVTGYLEANEDSYRQRREQIHIVFPGNQNSQTMSTQETKGVDTMRKNCYKRTDGRWQYSKQQNGFLYYTIANTYRELIEKIKNIKPRQIRHVQKVKSNVMTFIQYFELYMDTFIKTKKMAKETLLSWNRTLRAIADSFNRVPLDKLTVESIQKFISKIKQERTREVIYQRIVRVLKKAYATGRLKRDITLGLERPKRENIQERRPLNLKEQTIILDIAKKSNIYAFYIYSIVVGTRREESIKFNYLTDVDEEKGTIHIKGTKTKNADRYVYVSQGFLRFLKENLPSGEFKHGKDYYTKHIKELLLKANVESCLHALRHTCSANLLFLGANDKYRQMQLGHSSIVTTNDIYTNIKENIPKAKLIELYGDLYPSFD